MVIGNPTRTEESAIHGERNRKGGTGDPGRRWGGEDAPMLHGPLPGLLPGSGSAVRKKMAHFRGVLSQLSCRIMCPPPKESRNSEVSLRKMSEELREDSLYLASGFLK